MSNVTAEIQTPVSLTQPEHKPAYEIGRRLILFPEVNIKPWGHRYTEQDVKDFVLVEIEVTEIKVVPGSYKPSETHYGFRAKGSDGWNYVCNFDRFDEDANSPYQNWQREYLPGVHYVQGKDENGKSYIDMWICPEREFTERYLNWCITSLRRDLGDLNPMLVERVNKEFPNTPLFICNVEDKDYKGLPYRHADFGFQYVRRGDRALDCFACRSRAHHQKMMAEQEVRAAAFCAKWGDGSKKAEETYMEWVEGKTTTEREDISRELLAIPYAPGLIPDTLAFNQAKNTVAFLDNLVNLSPGEQYRVKVKEGVFPTARPCVVKATPQDLFGRHLLLTQPGVVGEKWVREDQVIG